MVAEGAVGHGEPVPAAVDAAGRGKPGRAGAIELARRTEYAEGEVGFVLRVDEPGRVEHGGRRIAPVGDTGTAQSVAARAVAVLEIPFKRVSRPRREDPGHQGDGKPPTPRPRRDHGVSPALSNHMRSICWIDGKTPRQPHGAMQWASPLSRCHKKPPRTRFASVIRALSMIQR
jgi:hypothetical protein